MSEFPPLKDAMPPSSAYTSTAAEPSCRLAPPATLVTPLGALAGTDAGAVAEADSDSPPTLAPPADSDTSARPRRLVGRQPQCVGRGRRAQRDLHHELRGAKGRGENELPRGG